jgi:hypothetical protein
MPHLVLAEDDAAVPETAQGYPSHPLVGRSALIGLPEAQVGPSFCRPRLTVSLSAEVVYLVQHPLEQGLSRSSC